MTKNEILDELRKGDYVFVEIDNKCSVGGEITYISYVKPMDEEGYYALTVDVLGQNVYFDSKRNVNIITYLKKNGDEWIIYDKNGVSVTELLKKYNIDDRSIAETIEDISGRWNTFTEEEKRELSYIICYYSKDDYIKELISEIEKDKKCIVKLQDWKIQKLDDEIAFLEKYENFKKFLPEWGCSLYDAIIYDVCGLKIG